MTYITYISNDRDIKGVVLLKYMLNKVNTKYTLQCICLENVSIQSKNTIRNLDINVIEINFENMLLRHGVAIDMAKHLVDKHYYGKFVIFLLIAHNNLIYLDSDLLIEKNIDHLFECKQVNEDTCLMTYDVLYSPSKNSFVIDKQMFNSGVIVFKPNSKHFQAFIEFVKGINTVDRFDELIQTDQTILNSMAVNQQLNIEFLPHEYNALPMTVELFSKLGFVKEDPSVIHFILSPKPWQFVELSTKQVTLYNNELHLHYYKKWVDTYHEFVLKRYHMTLSGADQGTEGGININNDTTITYC